MENKQGFKANPVTYKRNAVIGAVTLGYLGCILVAGSGASGGF